MNVFAAVGRFCSSPFFRIAALSVLLAAVLSCGSDQSAAGYNITLNGHAVIWAGYASSDPRLKQDLDATVVCLQSNGLRTRPGYPVVIVVDGTFDCNGVLANGCTELGGQSIYVTKQYLYTSVFTHEVVHWETGMGNEYHDTPLFETCTTIEEMDDPLSGEDRVTRASSSGEDEP